MIVNDYYKGQTVQELRIRRGFTVPQLAEILGIGALNLLEIEEGRDSLSLPAWLDLCKELNASSYEALEVARFLADRDHAISMIDELPPELLEV